LHRWLRILSVALVTAGLVVFVDVGLTLAWKEPISSIYGQIKQDEARNQLADLEKSFPSAADLRRLRGVHSSQARVRVLADRFARQATTGQAIGKIVIPHIDLDAVVVQGTDTASLEKGPGHYPDTPFPGQPGTVAIAGHRTTYLAPFRHIDSLVPGDAIHLDMPYANFTYIVTNHRIVSPDQTGIIRPVGYQQLVLTACNPLYSAAQRYAVFARLRQSGGRFTAGRARWQDP
jgi:sortase A